MTHNFNRLSLVSTLREVCVTEHEIRSSSRLKFCLCWRFWLFASVQLSLPAPRESKSMNKHCCSGLNRVWRSFQKHSVVLLAAVTSTRHRASVMTTKAPGYSCCEVAALSAAREYCRFYIKWREVFARWLLDAPILCEQNNKQMGVFLNIHMDWFQRERHNLLWKHFPTRLWDHVDFAATCPLSSVINISRYSCW